MKVYLDTIGCRLNQAEIESMASQFRAAGHEIVAAPGMAELAVVNTCAVTGDAVAASRAAVRRIALAGVRDITATGCWASLEPAQAAALPAVRRVVANPEKQVLVARTLDLPLAGFDLEPLSREPLPGLHRRTRAFIKVQDGCDNQCTFCITTVARGAGWSRPIAEVLADVRFALAGGTREIVLTGVHLGSWGTDLSLRLRDLVEAILQDTDVPRLRLSSLEPWNLDERFFSLWEDRRMMPHLHLPLQSGCRSTLRRMRRNTNPTAFRMLVQEARAVMPAVAITTDLIAGFPGETESEFAETLDFVRSLEFAGGHVFTYSARPGTGAARMKGQVPHAIRKARNRALQLVLEESAAGYSERFLGRRLPVLWEATSEMGESGWRMQGRTGNNLRVHANASAPRWNEIDEVEIVGVSAAGLAGIIRSS